MTPPKTYRTPAAFKVALEDRLKKRAALRGVQVNRVRQRFVMERFLARLAREFGDACVLKGGLALEFRIARARSTKDIDLRASGDPNAVLDRLRAAAAVDLADHLEFRVEPDREHPTIEDAVYEGRRFRVVATIAAQDYGSPFGLDVGMGDPMHTVPEMLSGEDFLDFLGIAPVMVPVYPVETHIAEKFHAYTRPLPDGRTNSRVRDLPDLALLATTKDFAAAELRAALERTFAFRETHALPAVVPPPPANWDAPYRALADEHDLAWRSITDATAAVERFLGPLLGGRTGRWDRAAWGWIEEEPRG